MKCSQACSTQQNPLMPPLTLVISTFDCRFLNWKPTAESLKSFTSNTSSFSRYVAQKYMYLPFEECYQVDFVKNNSFKRWFYVTVLVIFTQKYQKYAFLKKNFHLIIMGCLAVLLFKGFKRIRIHVVLKKIL